VLWNLYCRDPKNKLYKMPYHYSDLFMFGLKSDMLNIWDLNMYKETDESFIINKYGIRIMRYFPEQYIWLNFLRKYNKVICDRYDSKSRKIYRDSEKYMINNAVVLEQNQLGIRSLKESIYTHLPESCYSYKDWLFLYKRYTSLLFRLLNFFRDYPSRRNHKKYRLRYKSYKALKFLLSLLPYFIIKSYLKRLNKKIIKYKYKRYV
jgi:hypothetical protein